MQTLYLNPALIILTGAIGYLFIIRTHYTSYQLLRKSGYHVLYQSVIAGIILFICAYLLTSRFVTEYNLSDVISIKFSGKVTLLVSVVLSVVLPTVINVFYDSTKSSKKAAEAAGALMEITMIEAMERSTPVELSMQGGKSYIGFVFRCDAIHSGGIDGDVRLCLLYSGFRNKDTQELKITTNYPAMFKKLSSELQESVADDGFQIVLPVSEIRSVRFFSHEIYKHFQNQELTEYGDDRKNKNTT